MSSPLFSITIVTRNRRTELNRALESIHTQQYRPFEVIVVDNASQDGSAAFVDKHWPAVRLIRLHRNIGCQPARNIGMANCSGKYIFNLDDDGWLHPQTLNRVVERFEREPELSIINVRVIIPETDKQGWNEPVSGKKERYIANFSGCACAIRREDLAKIGYFPEYPRGHAEADLAIRALDAGKRLLYLPSAHVYHQPSGVERDRTEIRYWLTRHRLETSLRLSPRSYVLLELPWKLMLELRAAGRENSWRGFFGGLGAFCWNLPRIIRQRRPVAKKSIRLRDFLTYSLVEDPQELSSGQAANFSLLQVLKNKFRQKQK